MSRRTATTSPPPSRKARILVIDDEPDITHLLAYNLRARGHQVETLNDPTAAIGIAHATPPDLVILDIMMPHINGLQLCRMFRADPLLKNTPLILLTAKTGESDRVHGLETGSDDYICKPFSIKELVLRVEALLRRATPPPRQSGESDDGATATKSQARHVAGRIILDTERHTVHIASKPIELTNIEFKLLHLLMHRRGRVQTRENLLINVWSYETEIDTRTVDTHIRRLREKLGSEADWIQTLRGVGYRFAESSPRSKET
jgi:two-component system phosphate regulon response regulator PhoB